MIAIATCEIFLFIASPLSTQVLLNITVSLLYKVDYPSVLSLKTHRYVF